MTENPNSPFANRIMERDVATVLAMIHNMPNKRDRPLPGDLQGDFDGWFDGGAVKYLTGHNDYVFRNGVTASVGLSSLLSVSMRFPDGRSVIIEQKEPTKTTTFNNAMFQIYSAPSSIAEVSQQFAALRQTLNSVVQDVVVMKSVLEERGLMDAALYKKLRMAQMLVDHSSAGANPWENYSLYPYTQDEATFLRKALGATEAEVRNFEEEVESIQQRT